MNSYLEKYNLPIKQENLLKNLSLIVSRDSLNNYSFRYVYIYYYFVAKYLVENIYDGEVEKEMGKIMNNLHVDENAYIAIFMVHHSKNVKILDELKLNAMCLFDSYQPATLKKSEVKFFDDKADKIIEATLPLPSTTPENERIKALKYNDELDEVKNMEEESDEEDNPIGKELRRAIRTVEVMGCIIKNRAGSLPKTDLEEIFTQAVNVHLRMLSSFFELIKNENAQKDIVEFLSKRLEKIIAEKKLERKLSKEGLRRIAMVLFWNLNYFVVYGVVRKIIHSLGSDKLTEIVEKVCDEIIKTPIATIIKHGILMWYNKNLQIRELAKRLNDKEFSEIGKKVAKMMVSDYCFFHPIKDKDRHRIESLLKIKVKRHW